MANEQLHPLNHARVKDEIRSVRFPVRIIFTRFAKKADFASEVCSSTMFRPTKLPHYNRDEAEARSCFPVGGLRLLVPGSRLKASSDPWISDARFCNNESSAVLIARNHLRPRHKQRITK